MLKQVWSQVFRAVKVGSDDGKESPTFPATFLVGTLVTRSLFDDLAVDFISELRVSMAVLCLSKRENKVIDDLHDKNKGMND